eukprot:1143240-Pelagomonas_calceolata.AAC.3
MHFTAYQALGCGQPLNSQLALFIQLEGLRQLQYNAAFISLCGGSSAKQDHETIPYGSDGMHIQTKWNATTAWTCMSTTAAPFELAHLLNTSRWSNLVKKTRSHSTNCFPGYVCHIQSNILNVSTCKDPVLSKAKKQNFLRWQK